MSAVRWVAAVLLVDAALSLLRLAGRVREVTTRNWPTGGTR